MKKLIIFILAILTINLVIAYDFECPEKGTFIYGKVYYQNSEEGVNDATVDLVCHEKEKNLYKSTMSEGNGKYSVLFDDKHCKEGDQIDVSVHKEELYGFVEKRVEKCDSINVAVINVPLVPEFGLFAGVLTIISALGIFFIIRRG